MKRILVDTSVLLRCYYSFLLPILEYCSPIVGVSCWMSPSASWEPGVLGGQSLPWSEFLVVVLSTTCWLAMYCTRLIRTRITVSSASFRLLLPEFDIPELRLRLIHWSLKYEGVERPNFQSIFCRPRFECRMNSPTLAVFDTGTLELFEGAANRWLLPWVVFSSVFRGAGACGVTKAIHEKYCFSDLGLCYWF